MIALSFSPNCQTPAMGMMPHTEIGRALEVALSLDIPFWPQLPKINYFEDMYVQALENFPGVRADDPQTFRLTEEFSLVYHLFLEKDPSHYSAIRGQMISLISLGLKVVDQDRKLIIYQDEVREILFDFMLKELSKKIREKYGLTVNNEPRTFVHCPSFNVHRR
jgi:hypothetical protein